MHPLLKSKCRPRQKGIVDKETLKLEARLSQLIEINCLPIKSPDLSNYYGQAKAIAEKLGRSTTDLDKALKDQREIESRFKDDDGDGRYQHLVDQVSKQLDKLCLGKSH